jgi:hypothetical protein
MGEMDQGGQSIRVIVQETCPDVSPTPRAVYLSVQVGQSLLIGREGDLPAGVEIADTGISRRALTVAARPDGWQIISTNGNGAVLHPWGQAASWLERNKPLSRRWPRIGIRLIGSLHDAQHWVLLESDQYELPAIAELHGRPSTNTLRPARPGPLTAAQLDALRTVFAPHLAWPPVPGALPVKLEAAARRLHVSDGAVAQRLEAAQQRAYKLGSHRQVGVMDPEYMYVLVSNGYLPAPTARIDAVPLR